MGDCHVSVAADGRVPHRLAWGQGVVGAERAGTARACCARAVIEHGYDSATVAQIAQRAALTSSTFFRHFTDKREVLYWGQQALPSSSPLQVLGDALDAVGTAAFGWERHEFALRRRAVIATSSELQERQLLKRATLAATVASAFRDRGLDEPSATVVADPGSWRSSALTSVGRTPPTDRSSLSSPERPFTNSAPPQPPSIESRDDQSRQTPHRRPTDASTGHPAHGPPPALPPDRRKCDVQR